MMYLHDVWVNWFEGEENGYNVCHFHEWRKEDTIELLDQVPVLKVTYDLYHYIENDLADLPEVLLNDVYQKAYARKNHERIQLEYCFIVTDGISILAVDTLGYQIPIRKSRIIPRQEQLVYDMITNEETVDYSFTFPRDKEYHILSPEPALMIGLTRKERQLKKLLFMALDHLYSSKNTAQVRYWYTEWAPENYSSIRTSSFEDVWSRLYHEVKDGWTSKHEILCEGLIKGQPFFEKLWEMERGSKVN
ncbi:YjbA family protein [Caldibacillus lycopersici]|uniref:YjbA family protein n=1 Tax=Perspicuibacillus lycopersici TaxID=1325689 RepID=A0AAE3IQB3_9BACI|nr:YjbA family protein [Perspicuibacillus lycopersici]MCU9612442.1 YjbA family protein [Perspicuibacillus lycopersici]